MASEAQAQWDEQEAAGWSCPAAPPAPPPAPPAAACSLHEAGALCDALRRWHRCPELHKAIDGINYIADQTRKEEESTRVRITVTPPHGVSTRVL